MTKQDFSATSDSSSTYPERAEELKEKNHKNLRKSA
jgi:hypothetical protein